MNKVLKIVKIIFRITIKVTLVLWLISLSLSISNVQFNLNQVTKDLYREIIQLREAQNDLIKNDIRLSAFIYQLEGKTTETEEDIIKTKENIDSLVTQLTEINTKKILDTNVFVQTIMGEGAGTVIKKIDKEMYVLTCYHVVAEIVEMNKKGIKIGVVVGYTKTDSLNRVGGVVAYGAQIIKYDEDKDLALLKVFVTDDNLLVAPIATIEPEKGDTVYSIGSPLGIVHTISKGILSNKIEGFYISDNTTTFGNSGGGLYNKNGELIGVPSRVMVYANETGESTAPESSLGQSIDLQTIKEFLKNTEVTKEETEFYWQSTDY